MVLTPPEVVCHEFSVIVGIAVWTSVANILIKFFNLPEVVPMNIVFSYSAANVRGPDVAMHAADFSWLSHIIRIATDLGIMIIGVSAYDLMFYVYGVDYKYGQDPIALLHKGGHFSKCTKVFLLILIYISHFALMGSWRLGWNAVCVPFLYMYNEIMEYLFPN